MTKWLGLLFILIVLSGCSSYKKQKESVVCCPICDESNFVVEDYCGHSPNLILFWR